MVSKKKIIITLVLCIFILTMMSCSPQKLDALYETSTKIDFSVANIEEYSVDPFSINATVYYVSAAGDKLVVSDKPKDQYIYSFAGDNGYFVGVDLGEFDGWIKHIPYYSTLPEASEETLLCVENCKGFIKVNNTSAYAFTGSFGEYGKIYKLKCIGNEWNLFPFKEFEHTVVDYAEIDKKIYILTSKTLYLLSSDEELVTVFDVSDYSNVYLTSMAYINGKIFCGSVEGIFCFAPDTNDMVWYEAKY